eukprot:4255495-Amphidinium_carterae.1
MVTPAAEVDKVNFIAAVQRDALLLRHEDGNPLVPVPPTGHFMRRSGAKQLASETWEGRPLHRIQWLGRWGSSA